jgi:hypothetical protein
MKSFRMLMLLLALMPAAVFAPSALALALAPADKWTSTDPPINLVHIGFGEINRHGEAVGYHHRPNGMDPDGARVLQIIRPPDSNRVYRARISVPDPETGAWVRKKAPSTFFPDAMSDPDVVDVAVTAGLGSGTGFAIASDGVVIPNAVMESAQPEHYTLEELQAAFEIWIAAIERARRQHE